MKWTLKDLIIITVFWYQMNQTDSGSIPLCLCLSLNKYLKRKSWNIPKFENNVTSPNLSMEKKDHKIQVWKYGCRAGSRLSEFTVLCPHLHTSRSVAVIDLMPRSRMYLSTCKQCIKTSTGLRRLVNKLPEGQSRSILCRFYLLWNNKYVLQIEWHTYWRCCDHTV